MNQDKHRVYITSDIIEIKDEHPELKIGGYVGWVEPLDDTPWIKIRKHKIVETFPEHPHRVRIVEYS